MEVSSVAVKIRLKVREFAEKKGLSLAVFQRDAKLPVSTARRYWYGTTDGREAGERMEQLNLDTLYQISQFLNVEPGELLETVPD